VKILIADGNQDHIELLSYALRRAGFTTFAAADSATVLKMVKEKQVDLVLLEADLGASNGFDVLKSIRRFSDIPIIMLTGRDTEDDRVLGLEQGADDYVTKPFSHRELIGRIRAHFRRRGGIAAAPQTDTAVLQAGRISLDIAAHNAAHDGQPIDLTANEFRLLQCLMANAGSVVPTRVILKEVWGHDDGRSADVVRSTVCRLRRKLDDDPITPRLLRTVRGVGVMLNPEPSDAVATGR
jgi:DNA-binding response OmpR family regulator